MEPLLVNPSITIPAWEMWFTTSRSSGPGGQHVNKTSTRVSLFWDLARTTALTEPDKERLLARLATRLDDAGVLAIHVEDTRSQHRNKEVARERLVELIVENLKRPKRRRPTKPTLAAKRRRVDAKTKHGGVKRLRQQPQNDD